MYFLAKLFFPRTIKRLEAENNQCWKVISNRNNAVFDLNQELDKEKKKNKFFRSILSTQVKENAPLVAFKADKEGKDCFVINVADSMLSIYQINDYFNDYHRSLHLNYEIRSDYLLSTVGDPVYYLHLIDITNNEDNANRGIGSIALDQLIKIAKRHKCKYITGELSHVDSDNKERRFHFYEKFGFGIYHYPESERRNPHMYARIKLEL